MQVGLLLGVEAGLFPLMCGWWIDICSFVSNTLPNTITELLTIYSHFSHYLAVCGKTDNRAWRILQVHNNEFKIHKCVRMLTVPTILSIVHGCLLGTITFFHWLAGMVYIFYFASLVMLLREVGRL